MHPVVVLMTHISQLQVCRWCCLLFNQCQPMSAFLCLCLLSSRNFHVHLIYTPVNPYWGSHQSSMLIFLSFTSHFYSLILPTLCAIPCFITSIASSDSSVTTLYEFTLYGVTGTQNAYHTIQSNPSSTIPCTVNELNSAICTNNAFHTVLVKTSYTAHHTVKIINGATCSQIVFHTVSAKSYSNAPHTVKF